MSDDEPRSCARSWTASPPTSPGDARRRPEGAPAYKLSSNENPYPPLPGVLEAATAAAGDVQPLPGHGLHRP